MVGNCHWGATAKVIPACHFACRNKKCIPLSFNFFFFGHSHWRGLRYKSGKRAENRCELFGKLDLWTFLALFVLTFFSR